MADQEETKRLERKARTLNDFKMVALGRISRLLDETNCSCHLTVHEETKADYPGTVTLVTLRVAKLPPSEPEAEDRPSTETT